MAERSSPLKGLGGFLVCDEVPHSTSGCMQVESLLVEIETAEEGETGMGDEALDARCRMLERLASEVSRLGYYATKGKVSCGPHCP